jgi:competence protein ComEC
LLKQGVLGRVTGSFNQVFYSSVSDIVTSLVLGNGSHMRDSISHLFKLTGTQHLMAISGFNLSFLAVLLNSLYGKLLPKSITFWLNLLIISFYTCLVGFSPGLFRAFLMFFLSGLAWKTNRQKMAIYSLFLTAVIAISIDIKVIYSISFQLSYAATLGIIVFTRYINFTSQSQDSMFVDLPRVSTAIWSYLIDSFWLSFAAQIAVFPLVAYQFKEINLIGIVATSLVSWIIPIVLSLAYSFSIFQFLLPLKFLFIFFFPLHYLTSLMFTLLNAVAFKRAIMPLPNFSFWHTVVAYLLISLIYCAFIIIKQQKIIKKHDQIYHFCF